MGSIRKGILGGFAGKGGTVVGISWKGGSYMRSLAGKIRNPRSPLQMAQRTKFALTINYLKPMNALLRAGWKLYAQGDTIFLERYRYLYKNKIVRDSIFINDTIRVPYPVDVVKEVKKPLSNWQNFQVWCGRMVLIIILLAVIYFALKGRNV